MPDKIERIQTWQQLLEEKQRLQLLIGAQKELVRSDLKEIGQELKPLNLGYRFIRSLVTRRKNGVLDYGTNFFVDLFVKNLLLSRAGWFLKFLVPFAVKNMSSHVVGDYKDSIFHKLRAWLKKVRNGHSSSEENRKESESPSNSSEAQQS